MNAPSEPNCISPGHSRSRLAKMAKFTLAGLVVISCLAIFAARKFAADLATRAVPQRENYEARSLAESRRFAQDLPNATAIVHVPTRIARDVLKQFVGTKIFKDGVLIEIVSAELEPRLGAMHARLEMRAGKDSLEGNFQMKADVLFQGVGPVGADGNRLVKFRLVPSEIGAEGIAWGLDFRVKTFLAGVLKNLATIKLDDLLEVGIPVPAFAAVEVKLPLPDSLPLGQGTVTVGGELPAIKARLEVPYAGVVFTPTGLLVVAQEAAVIEEKPSAVTTASLNDLIARSPLAGKNKLVLWLGRTGFDNLLAKMVASMPKEADIKPAAVQGKLFTAQGFRDNVLGEGKLYGEVQNVGTIRVTCSAPSFTLQDGHLSLKASVDASAQNFSVHLHLQVSLFGVGTSVGMLGSAKTNIGLEFIPAVLPDRSAIVFTSRFSQSDFQAEVTTNGAAKFGNTGVQVAKVGAKGRGQLAGLAEAPRFVLFSRTEMMVPISAREQDGMRIAPASSALTFDLSPESVQVRASGLTAEFNLTTIGQATLSKQKLATLGEKVLAANLIRASDAKIALGKISVPRGPGSYDVALLLAGIEFGPNNDLVKLLKAILAFGGQITDAGGKVLEAARQEAERILASAEAERRKLIERPLESLRDAPGNAKREANEVLRKSGLPFRF